MFSNILLSLSFSLSSRMSLHVGAWSLNVANIVICWGNFHCSCNLQKLYLSQMTRLFWIFQSCWPFQLEIEILPFNLIILHDFVKKVNFPITWFVLLSSQHFLFVFQLSMNISKIYLANRNLKELFPISHSLEIFPLIFASLPCTAYR